MARGRGKYKGKGRPKADGEEDGSGDEEGGYKPANRGLGGQSSTAGMLPPSASGSEEDEPKPVKPAAPARPPPGSLPPAASSSSEESSSEDSDSSDEPPVNDYLTAPRQPKAKAVPEVDPEQVRKDMERLELIRKKRETDRLKRIAQEGWDRFAPVSDTNRPPGHVPSDHPDHQKK